MESLKSGTKVGIGSFRCEGCGHVVALATEEALPDCPDCGGSSFARTALPGTDARDQQWMEHARSLATGTGGHLAYDDGGRIEVVPLAKEWTRVGRSPTADVSFEDPTVSRRHALIIRQPDGVQVVDDRSQNGVFVNGERVESRTLNDGDEILVGRYRLRYLEVG
jgi:predicted  nucleic acid-binding Zn-ribbon protein